MAVACLIIAVIFVLIGLDAGATAYDMSKNPMDYSWPFTSHDCAVAAICCFLIAIFFSFACRALRDPKR